MTSPNSATEQPITSANTFAEHHSSELQGFSEVDSATLASLVRIGKTLKAAEDAPYVQELLAANRRDAAADYVGGTALALNGFDSDDAIKAEVHELQTSPVEQLPSSPAS